MNTIKHLLGWCLWMGCLACNNKELAFQQTSSGPVLGFSKDTFYVREKDPNNLHGNGVLQIQTLPEDRQLHLRLYDSSDQVQFRYRGQLLANDQAVIVSGAWNELFCLVNRSGLYAIDVSLKDQLGRGQNKTLMIQAAAAQRPKASLHWKVDARDAAGRRYYFDASGCLQPYGKIMSYHYQIAGQSIVSSSEQFQYIFHQKGSYPISFYVKDDLGQHSDTLQQIIDIL